MFCLGHLAGGRIRSPAQNTSHMCHHSSWAAHLRVGATLLGSSVACSDYFKSSFPDPQLL